MTPRRGSRDDAPGAAGTPATGAPGLGELEAQVMEALWAMGEASIRDVWERLRPGRKRPLAFNTVMTVMNRLVEKGLLRRSGARGHYLFRPALSREAYARDLARTINRRIFDVFQDAAVAGFVESIRELDTESLRQLEAFIHRERVSRGDEPSPQAGEPPAG